MCNHDVSKKLSTQMKIQLPCTGVDVGTSVRVNWSDVGTSVVVTSVTKGQHLTKISVMPDHAGCQNILQFVSSLC